MRFTRKELKRIFEEAEVTVPKDVISAICDLHTSSNEDIADELSEAKDKLKAAEKENERLKKNGAGEDSVSKEDYDSLKQEFDDYKKEISDKQNKATKQKAYKELLKEANISDKRIDLVLKVSADAIDKIKLDKDGKVENSKEHIDAIKKEWADFVVKKDTKAAEVQKPNSDTNKGAGGMTKADILKITDRDERRQAIADNLDLFD